MSVFKKFSPKQKLIFTWWSNQKFKQFDAIICDGAIRSGKTFCMSISFILWAFSSFNCADFAICGKTISSIKRNVAYQLTHILKKLGFVCKLNESKNYLDVFLNKRCNRFYFFGGNNESSAALIQGTTLAGALLDEVVLMPQSFVEQTIARCSLTNSKFWFNCNPQNPSHWFFKEWIEKRNEKNALYVHLTMQDNPSLSKQIIERYEKLYCGTFHERFVKGKWVNLCERIYPMFSIEKHVVKKLPSKFERFVVSCDYGIVNPTSFGLWGLNNSVWFRIDEFYHDSKISMTHLTDEDHYFALKKLISNRKVDLIVIDPSAASFIACIKKHGEFKAIKAKNDVLIGINLVINALNSNKIKFSDKCINLIREFFQYQWQNNSTKDSVKKENDHAMDDLRYFVSTILNSSANNFFVSTNLRVSK